MKKGTHLLLSRYLLQNERISSIPTINKFWIYLGSVEPDLTPLCLLHPHQYNSRNKKICKKLDKLNFRKKNWRYYFSVGIISHYLADFFTAPHNRHGVAGFCTNHRNYERALHKYFVEQLKRNGFNSSAKLNEAETKKNNYLENNFSNTFNLNVCVSDLDSEKSIESKTITDILPGIHKSYLEQPFSIERDFQFIYNVVKIALLEKRPEVIPETENEMKAEIEKVHKLKKKTVRHQKFIYTSTPSDQDILFAHYNMM